MTKASVKVGNAPAKRDVAETMWFGMLLSCSGGLMDAYTYLFRGHVFANAQTGNILLLAVNLTQGKWLAALNCFCPIAAFAFGIMISCVMIFRAGTQKALSVCKSAALVLETALLLGVAFIPQELNWLANALVSLACGVQLEMFRTVSGNSAATTMCIGNLRSAIHFAFERAMKGRNSTDGRPAVYALVILSFMTGAAAGAFLINEINIFAIAGSSVILFVCWLILVFNKSL